MQNKAGIRTKKVISMCLALLFWLVLWLIIYKKTGTDLLVSSPLDVAERLFSLLKEIEFYSSVFRSFLTITKGYVFGVLGGLILGTLISFSKVLSSLFKPFLTAVKTTPVVSFIILALIWIPRYSVPTFITFLMVLPIISAGVMSGLGSADTELLEMARVYHLPPLTIARRIYIPTVLPYFRAACTGALGLGWKAGIAAEVLTVPGKSIGRMISESKLYLLTEDLFAWTLAVVLLSLGLQKISLKLLAGRKSHA